MSTVLDFDTGTARAASIGPGAALAFPSTAAPTAQEDGCCFHCGLPAAAASPWKVAIDGVERTMCCPGCAAVAQAIVDAGQSSWYGTSDGYAATASGADALPPELALYRNDDPRFALDATD